MLPPISKGRCDMKNNFKISMLGGDRRQCALAQALSRDYNIKIWGIPEEALKNDGNITFCEGIQEALDDTKIIVLPLPASTDGITLNCPLLSAGEAPKLSSVLKGIPRGRNIIGGRISESFRCAAEACGTAVFDYFESEDFQIKNAYTTAEAALSIAMNTLDRNIRGANAAITGFGRITKHLAALLHSVGASVTVAARSSKDLAWAESLGYKTIRIGHGTDTIMQLKSGYDVIYNTVPHWLFDRKFLEEADKSTFIVDLASAPGGVDICAARELSSNVSWAASLPGKYAPRSAGELIAECVGRIIREEVVL